MVRRALTLHRRRRAPKALFYILGGVTLTANALIGGESVSLRLFFDAEAVTFSTAPGVGVAAAWFLAGLARWDGVPHPGRCVPQLRHFLRLASSLGLMLIVERTQKCWDFGLTLYLFHVAACTMYQVPGRPHACPMLPSPAQAAHWAARARDSPPPGPGGWSPPSPAPP